MSLTSAFFLSTRFSRFSSQDFFFTTSVRIDLPWIFYNFILFVFSRFTSSNGVMRKFLLQKGFFVVVVVVKFMQICNMFK